jgi:hypothetical protein
VGGGNTEEMSSQVKVLCIGDPHIRAENFNEIKLMITALREVLIQEEVDFACVMGDTLHTFEIVNTNCLTLATELFRMIRDHCPHLYIIVGNHEVKNNQAFLSKRHPYNAFKEWEKTTVVDDVIEHTYKGQKFIFTPFIPDGRFLEALNTKGFTPPFLSHTAIFGHSDFHGSSINKLSSAKLDTWDDNSPPAIMGHLHDYEEVGKVIFVGTPLQHANHDSGEKTVSLFTFFPPPRFSNSSNTPSDVSSDPSSNTYSNTSFDVSSELPPKLHLEKDSSPPLTRGEFLQKRINLHIPKRLLIKLTVEELATFTLPEDCSFITLRVEGLSKDIENVMRLKHVIELDNMKEKVKIIKILTDSKLKTLSSDISSLKKRKSLRERIRDTMAESTPETIKVFSSLFFEITKKNSTKEKVEKVENDVKRETKIAETKKGPEFRETKKEPEIKEEKIVRKSRLRII